MSYLNFPVSSDYVPQKPPKLFNRIHGGQWSNGERERFEAFERGKRHSVPRGYVYHISDPNQEYFVLLASPFLPNTRFLCRMKNGLRPPSGSYVELTGEQTVSATFSGTGKQSYSKPFYGDRYFQVENFSLKSIITDQPELSPKHILQEILEPNWEGIIDDEMLELATYEYISSPPISTTRGGYQIGVKNLNHIKKPAQRFSNFIRNNLPIEFQNPLKMTVKHRFLNRNWQFEISTPYSLDTVNYEQISNWKALPTLVEPCRVIYVDKEYRRKKKENQIEWHGDINIPIATYPEKRRKGKRIYTDSLLRSIIAYIDMQIVLSSSAAKFLSELSLQSHLAKVASKYDLIQKQLDREHGLRPEVWCDINKVTRLAAAIARGEREHNLTVETVKCALKRYLGNYSKYLEFNQEFNPSIANKVFDPGKQRLNRNEVNIIRIFRIYDINNHGLFFREIRRFLEIEKLPTNDLYKTIEIMTLRRDMLLFTKDFKTGEIKYRVNDSVLN